MHVINHHIMAEITHQIVWLHYILVDLGFAYQLPMPMYCNNQASNFIAKNPTVHE